MRLKKYSCPNGCKLPPRTKVLRESKNHEYRYDYDDFPYCPLCGGFMPYTLQTVKDFFDVYHLHPKLQKAERLIYKSEFESAAREAFVVVETVLREKSGLDLHGFELATKALKFEVDKQTGEVTKQPFISINDLKTESEKNEQDGIRYMLMGFFQGVRNLYQHNHIGSGASNSLMVVLNASFYLNLLDGHSITKKGKWLTTKVDYREIYKNMPNPIDRIRLLHSLKKRKYSIASDTKSQERK